MGRPPLFKDECLERPTAFSFLIRPTNREYRDFVLTLDQMLSDNISPDFLMDEVEPREYRRSKDGNIEVLPKGTIRMLEEWLRARFSAREPQLLTECFDGLRRIRKERQKPAHVLQVDVWDESYRQKQRDLLIAAHDALRLLRTAFQGHPAVRPDEVPCLPREKGTIWLQ